jgi:hypothetical protein
MEHVGVVPLAKTAISGMSTKEATPKMSETNTREEKGCQQQQEAT